MKVWGRVLDAAQDEGLDGTIPLRAKALQMKVMHLMIGIRRGLMANGAPGLAEKHIFTLDFKRRCLLPVEPACHRIQFGSRRKVDHVLHLRHVGDGNAINNIHPFFDRPDHVAVEIGRALFELREILDRPKAAL